MGEIRGILLRTIAGFGLCVLAATAVDRTLFHESFVPVPIDMSADRRVDAYVPFYKRMLPLANLENGISAIDLRNLADDMILASQSGQLQPIVASFHGEELEESPKGRLVNTTIRLAKQLTEVASAEFNAGRIDDAVSDAIRASALVETIRFTSDDTVMRSAPVIRQSLEISSNNISKVKKLEPHLVRQLAIAQTSKARFEEMERRSATLNLVYSIRYGVDETMTSNTQSSFFDSRTRAQKFLGIDREATLLAKAKACQFYSDSKLK
jgi:hypothetical protein